MADDLAPQEEREPDVTAPPEPAPPPWETYKHAQNSIPPWERYAAAKAPEEEPGTMTRFGRGAARGITGLAGSALQGAAEIYAGKQAPENSLYKAGEATKKYGEDTFPLTPEQADSFAAKAGEMVGGASVALPAAGAALLGAPAAVGTGLMAFGAGLFGLSGYGEGAEKARAAGASDDQVRTAAIENAALNTVAGALDLGMIMKPVAKAGPGVFNWALAKLNQAARSGATFAGVGEAQKWVESKIAQEYDPSAQYQFSPEDMGAAAVAGGLLGIVHPLHKAPPVPERTPGAGAETPAGTEAPPPPGATGRAAAVQRFVLENLSGTKEAEQSQEAPSNAPPGDAGISGVAQHEAAVPESQARGLAPLRGTGDIDPSAMADKLPRVLSGSGAAPEQASLVGPDTSEQRVRAGQRQVSDEGRAVREQEYNEVPDAGRRNDDDVGLGQDDRNARGEAARQTEARDGIERGAGPSSYPEGEFAAARREADVDKGLGQSGRDQRAGTAEAPEEGDVNSRGRDQEEAAAQNVHAQEIADRVDAADADVDPNPTPAKVSAGTYKKGHPPRIPGLGHDISIETAAAGERRSVDPANPWVAQMPADTSYGHILRTKSTDGEPVDAFIGPEPASPKAWVIDQVNPETREHDEPKVMLGFRSREEAIDRYTNSFSDGRGPDRIGAITETTIPELRDWLRTDGPRSKPFIDHVGERPHTADIDMRPLYDRIRQVVGDDVSGRLVARIKDGMADGEFRKDPALGRLINLASDQSPENIRATLNHEMLHALRDLGVFDDGEWRVLADEANRTHADTAKDAQYEGLLKDRGWTPEQIADKIEEERVARMMGDALGGREPAGIVKPIIAKFGEFMEALRNWARGMGLNSARGIVRKIDQGKYANRGTEARAEEPAYALRNNEQTETPEFKRWFGDSKVVDESGKPLVVYHGTVRDFESFNPREFDGGIYFTTSPEDAAEFAEIGDTRNPPGGGERVLPAYLSLKSPLEIDADGAPFTEDIQNRISAEIHRGEMTGQFDGVVVRNVDALGYGPPSDMWVALRPEQIKSAVGNRGTFDPNDKRIDYALRNPPEKDLLGQPMLKPEILADQIHDDLIHSGFEKLMTRLRGTEHGRMVDRYQKGRPWESLRQLSHDLADLVSEGMPGQLWYERSSKAILDMVGGDKAAAEKLAQVIAIYSPQSTVPTNTGFALKSWNKWKNGEPLWSGKHLGTFTDKTVYEGADDADARKYMRDNKLGLATGYRAEGNKVIQAGDLAAEKLKNESGGKNNRITVVPLENGETRVYQNGVGYDNTKSADQDLKAHLVLNEGVPFNGRKTNNFYVNLMRQIDPQKVQGVTSDLWMSRAFGFHDDAVGDRAKYDYIEGITRAMAERMEWEPQQVQAAIWSSMKGRVEAVRDAVKEEAVQKGFVVEQQSASGSKELVPAGKTDVQRKANEERYTDLLRNRAMEYELDPHEIAQASKDFADHFGNNVARLAYESVPSTAIEHLAGLDKLPFEAREQLHRDVAEAFIDPKTGRNEIVDAVGALADEPQVGRGVWEGASNPASYMDVAVSSVSAQALKKRINDLKKSLPRIKDKAEKATATKLMQTLQASLKEMPGDRDLIPAAKATMNGMSMAYGLVTKQDGVGWHKPFYTDKTSAANGVRFRATRPLNEREILAIGDAAAKYGAVPIPSPDGMRLLYLGDKKPKTLIEDLKKIFDRNTGVDLWSDADMFASTGDLKMNSWKDHPDGQQYVEGLRAAGRPDVLRAARNVLGRIASVERAFAERHGLEYTDVNDRIDGAIDREIVHGPRQPAGDYALRARDEARDEAREDVKPARALAAPIPAAHLEPGPESQRDIMSRFGTVNPGRDTTNDLKQYELQPLIDHPELMQKLLDEFGANYKEFAYHEDPDAGVKFTLPKLKKDGYGKGTVWIYNPRVAGGSFKDEAYTRAWRVTHELAHGLVEPMIAAKYGASQREGRLGQPSEGTRGTLGKQVKIDLDPLSLTHAQRAVEWEDAAFRAQRQLLDSMGIKIPDDVFAREYNTNLGDAVYRTLTGAFGDPGEHGFDPATTPAPLKDTLQLLQRSERTIAKRQGREPTQGQDLAKWKPISDQEISGAIDRAREAKSIQPQAAAPSYSLRDLPDGRKALEHEGVFYPVVTRSTEFIPGVRLLKGMVDSMRDRPQRAAADFVVGRGEKTGFEWAALLDGKGEPIDAYSTRNPAAVGWTFDALSKVLDPASAVTFHHNHPSGSALSTDDLRTLSLPGLRWMVAHGSDGSFSAARLTDEFKSALEGLPGIEAFRAIEGISDAADLAAFRELSGVKAGMVSEEDLKAVHNAITNHSLAALGVIDYMDNRRVAAILEKPLLDGAYRAALKAGNDAIQQGGFPVRSAADVRSYRPTVTVRPDEGLARIHSDGQEAAAGRAGPVGDQARGDVPEGASARGAQAAEVGPDYSLRDPLSVKAPEDIDQNAKVHFDVPLYRGVGGLGAGRFDGSFRGAPVDARAALRPMVGGDLGDGIYFTQHAGLAATYGGGPKASISNGQRAVHGYKISRDLYPDEVAYMFGGIGPNGADDVSIVSGTGVELYRGKWEGGTGKPSQMSDALGDTKVVIGTPNSVGLNQIAVRDPSILEPTGTTYDKKNPLPKQQAMFSLRDRAREVMESEPVRALTSGRTGTALKNAWLTFDRAFRMVVSPASLGNETTRAVAKTFKNEERKFTDAILRLDNMLKSTFTRDERKEMWEASDEESVMQQRAARGEEEVDPSRGLGRLSPELRATVEVLQRLQTRAWQDMYDSGIVKAENGLPNYTPRMFAEIMEDGSYERVSGGKEGEKGGSPLERIGSNVDTSGPRRRKYETTEETEAAAKAKKGENVEVVKDIRTMLVSYAKAEKAVRSRRMTDSIRKLGDEGGMPLVQDHEGPEYFTLDHPSFKTWSPDVERVPLDRNRIETQARQLVEQAGGDFNRALDLSEQLRGRKPSPADAAHFDQVERAIGQLRRGEEINVDDSAWHTKTNAQGNPAFVAKPLYIHRSFEGPLRSVLNKPSSALYRGLMDMKIAGVSMVMISPAIHLSVEIGRSFPLMPGKMLMGRLFIDGSRAMNDDAVRREFYQAGGVSTGFGGYLADVTDIANEPMVKPGRSILTRGIGNVVGLFGGEGANMATRRGIDAFGHFWHDTLLWKNIERLQFGIYTNMRDTYLKGGMTPQAAQTAAAHQANRFAGSLPQEAMGDVARKVANIALFSRTFTLGNLGVMKDMFKGLPRDTYAKLVRDVGRVQADAASSEVKKKAIHAFAFDLALFYGMNAAVQVGVSLMSGQQSEDQVADGFWRRAKSLAHRVSEHPMDILNPFDMAQSLMPGGENEPGKEGRIYFGRDATGRAIYGRNAFGKIGEEFAGWLTSPVQMLRNKTSTLVHPLIDIYQNQDSLGRKVYNTEDKSGTGMMKALGNIVMHFMQAQLPMQTIQGIHDLATGAPGADMNATKAILPLVTGVTLSSGYPGGPRQGEIARSNRDKTERLASARGDARKLAQSGRAADAIKTLTGAGEDPQDAIRAVRGYMAATQRQQSQLQRFQRKATPEEQERLRNITGGS